MEAPNPQGINRMSITFNHTIVAARDKRASAEFLTELFDLPPAMPAGHFLSVDLANGVTLDFAQAPPDAEIHPQHYAFLVSEKDFDVIYEKIQARRMAHWADPRQARSGDYNTNDGGRGVYFLDLDGHYLEIITVPYGGW